MLLRPVDAQTSRTSRDGGIVAHSLLHNKLCNAGRPAVELEFEQDYKKHAPPIQVSFL